MLRHATVLVVLGLLQACQVPPGVEQSPQLAFPEAGVDDPAAYEGYTTRFFRDADRNVLQVYLDTRRGRVVHLWADAANASASFTIRDPSGAPVVLDWGGPGAIVSRDEQTRVMRHRLTSASNALAIGWFVLGTMRQERDFQYWEWDQRAYDDEQFVLAEFAELVESIERLPADEQERHLSLLSAGDLDGLRSRLTPTLSITEGDGVWSVLVEHMSMDGRNRITLELRGDAEVSTATLDGDSISVAARSGASLEFEVIATSDFPTLTPLERGRIFNDAFEEFLVRERNAAEAGGDAEARAFRRLEREVRGLELLSFEEKLMASMPNYATYFGRDMMMAALMLEPVSSVDLQERVIASVIRKIAPTGDVSHEEALAGQAIRERAAEYNGVIREWEEVRDRDPSAADDVLERARTLLANPQGVLENYRMIDDDFQLAVLVDRYLARPDVPGDRKRRFLNERLANDVSHLEVFVTNLMLVARLSRAYAEEPITANMVAFQYRDEGGWLPGSWRDSRVGYGAGRYAMDVNVVWVPKALEAAERILQALAELGFNVEDLVSRASPNGSMLETYVRDPSRLREAIETWRGARRRFEVRFDPADIRRRVDAMLASMQSGERAYWSERLRESGDPRPLAFLALSLDSLGRPIAGANTDVATDLFFEPYTERILRGEADPATVLEMLDVLVRPYPVGLFVPGLGPVVVNDAYASASVQQQFRDDAYHSPRVVWGREVNLVFLSLAHQIEAAYDENGELRDDSESFREYVAGLREILETTREAVDASNLRHNELWSYRIENGTLRPMRYGVSSDIQLWNLTDLAVRFLLERLPRE